MKKMMLTVLVVVITMVSVNAQQNVIKVNPLGLAFGSAGLEFERALSEKSSVEISLAYSSSKVSLSGVSDNSKATGFGVEGKYKLYFSKTNSAPRGWYAAPLVTYASAKASSSNSEGKVSLIGAGAIGGYQWVFGGRSTGFALDLNLGAQYVSASTSGSINSASIDGFLPRLGLSIGYAW